MTTFIIWDKSDDTAFRQRYFDVTGERVQAQPDENVDDTKFMVGSARISASQLSALGKEFSIETDTNSFVQKPEQTP